MRKELLALLGFIRRQVGLRTDPASATGNLHSKVGDVKDCLGMERICIASNTLRASSDVESEITSTTLAKIKAFRIHRTGIIRLSVDMRSRRATQARAAGYIYRNGNVYGVKQTSDSETYVTKTWDLFFERGDSVELWGNDEIQYNAGVYFRNFRLYYDFALGDPSPEVLL